MRSKVTAMALHGREIDEEFREANALLFSIFTKNNGFWWPYHSIAKALLGTQRNAFALLE